MNKFDFKNWNCNVVEKKKLWMIISTSIIVVGFLVAIIFGFNVGIDFSGGTVVTVTVGDLYDDNSYTDYKNIIDEVTAKHGINVQVEQKLSGGEFGSGIQVRYQNQISGSDADEVAMSEVNKLVTADIETAVKALIGEKTPSITADRINDNVIVGMSNVGASASAELLLKAFLAIAVASLLILGYTAIRFEFLSGLTAIMALIHDILVMTACMAIFRIQMNATFVAALITIVGYSINNTIILFDRVRENKVLFSMRDSTPTSVINTSIKETMTRSIYTSITTLVTIVALAIFGVSQMREFALPIIFGLLAGTYSSICIAPTLWAIFKDMSNKKLDQKKHAYKSSKSTK